MDALVILLVGGLIAVGLWSWLAPRAGRHGLGGEGRGRARRPAGDEGGLLGLRSARAITESREELEAEDLAQMLAAHNAWRRRRGRPERTVEDVELMVAGQARELRRERDAEPARAREADAELEQLLEATNARRRARGLPERDRDDVRRLPGG